MIKTLIIHNIPRDIRVTDLRYLFEKYGPIRDIYIPRNMDRSSRLYDTIKGFALIKFFNAMDAQSAYDAEFGRLYIGFKLISIEFAKEDR
jgi:FUS-interacting serine-arginine-rich protein 1